MTRAKVMLDSGAYSAWTHGEVIDIDKYIAFIKRNSAAIDTYVNLDVIPGRPGRKPTEEEVEESARQSYRNLQKMKAAGLNPLPVFHQGERFYWLQKLLDDGHTVIGISPAANLRGLTIQRWLDRVFTILTTEDGIPIVRTHGFGVGAVELIVRYPWTSVDSASWIHRSIYGRIWLPEFDHGAFQYIRQPKTVMVTEPRSLRRIPSDHFDKLYEIEKHYVHKFLEEEVGTSYALVKSSYEARHKANAVYYMKLHEQHSKADRRFKNRRSDVSL